MAVVLFLDIIIYDLRLARNSGRIRQKKHTLESNKLFFPLVARYKLRFKIMHAFRSRGQNAFTVVTW